MSIAHARQLRKEMPRPEAIMWNALRSLKPLGFRFRRQVPLGPYYADFAWPEDEQAGGGEIEGRAASVRKVSGVA